MRQRPGPGKWKGNCENVNTLDKRHFRVMGLNEPSNAEKSIERQGEKLGADLMGLLRSPTWYHHSVFPRPTKELY